ncbi:MAG: hypothetical protein ABIM22_07700 [candidate division WOR-3 bacterium]
MARLFLTGTYKDGLLWVQKRLERLGNLIIRPDFGAGGVTISDIDAIVFLGKQTNDYFVNHFSKSGFPVFAPSQDYKKILQNPSLLKDLFGQENVVNYLESDSVRDLINFFDLQETHKKFVLKIYDSLSGERIETLVATAEYLGIWLRDFMSKRPFSLDGSGINFVVGNYIDGAKFGLGAFFKNGQPLKPYTISVKSYQMFEGSNIYKELPVWVFRFPLLEDDLPVLNEWFDLLSNKISVGTNYVEINFILSNDGKLVISSITNRLDPTVLEIYNFGSILLGEESVLLNPHINDKFFVVSNLIISLQNESVLKIKSTENFDELSVLRLRDDYYASMDWYAGYQTVYGSDVEILLERVSSLALFESPYLFCVKSKDILSELRTSLFLMHLNKLISSSRYMAVLPQINQEVK